MSGKRRGFTLGTILTLCLTVIVTVGCVLLFGRIRSGNPDAQMNAEKVIGLVGNALQGNTQPPEAPQSTVRTVTVTLAPTLVPSAAPTVQATPRQVRESYSFTLTVGGLMAFHSDISDSVYDSAAKMLDYRPVVSLLASKVTADLNLVTLPQGMNLADTKYADALVPAVAADAILAAGFDDVLLSTEHVLDQGAQGAADTVSALTARGLSCGGVNTGAARQNRMLQLNGAHIAVLSYTDALTAKSKNAQSAQTGLLTPFDVNKVCQEIRAARSQGADCVIVCLYWGKENTTNVTSAMRTTAETLAKAGADVILGTRPTRVLPVEMLAGTREDGSFYECLAAYSLGSLLTESREGYDISGMLLHLTLRCDGQGKLHFDAVQYTPTYIWRQNIGGRWQYRVVCSADPAPEGMSDQQKEVMQRALNRIQTTLKNSPVTQR